MKARLRERGHRGSFGLFIERVVVAAEREPPDVSVGRAAAGASEIVPGESAFDRPAFVAVGAIVESPAANHGGLPVKFAVAFGLLEGNSLALEVDVEHRAGGVDLKLVIRRLVLVRPEEQLEDVAEPGAAVVLRQIGKP